MDLESQDVASFVSSLNHLKFSLRDSRHNRREYPIHKGSCNWNNTIMWKIWKVFNYDNFSLVSEASNAQVNLSEKQKIKVTVLKKIYRRKSDSTWI